MNSVNGFFINDSNELFRARYVAMRVTTGRIRQLMEIPTMRSKNLEMQNERAIYAVKHYKEYKKSFVGL